MKSATVRRCVLSAVVLLGTCLSVACGGREHMSDDYGVHSRRFFIKQRVHSQAAQDNPKGLDSEEAALIQGSYREDMGGSKAEPKESPSKVLIVEENKENAVK